jgi:hypothetical protein
MKIVDWLSLSEDVRWTMHGVRVEPDFEIVKPTAKALAETQQRLKQLTTYSDWEVRFGILRAGVAGKLANRLQRLRRIG